MELFSLITKSLVNADLKGKFSGPIYWVSKKLSIPTPSESPQWPLPPLLSPDHEELPQEGGVYWALLGFSGSDLLGCRGVVVRVGP